MQLTEAGRD